MPFSQDIKDLISRLTKVKIESEFSEHEKFAIDLLNELASKNTKALFELQKLVDPLENNREAILETRPVIVNYFKQAYLPDSFKLMTLTCNVLYFKHETFKELNNLFLLHFKLISVYNLDLPTKSPLLAFYEDLYQAVLCIDTLDNKSFTHNKNTNLLYLLMQQLTRLVEKNQLIYNQLKKYDPQRNDANIVTALIIYSLYICREILAGADIRFPEQKEIINLSALSSNTILEKLLLALDDFNNFNKPYLVELLKKQAEINPNKNKAIVPFDEMKSHSNKLIPKATGTPKGEIIQEVFEQLGLLLQKKVNKFSKQLLSPNEEKIIRFFFLNLKLVHKKITHKEVHLLDGAISRLFTELYASLKNKKSTLPKLPENLDFYMKRRANEKNPRQFLTLTDLIIYMSSDGKKERYGKTVQLIKDYGETKLLHLLITQILTDEDLKNKNLITSLTGKDLFFSKVDYVETIKTKLLQITNVVYAKTKADRKKMSKEFKKIQDNKELSSKYFYLEPKIDTKYLGNIGFIADLLSTEEKFDEINREIKNKFVYTRNEKNKYSGAFIKFSWEQYIANGTIKMKIFEIIELIMLRFRANQEVHGSISPAQNLLSDYWLYQLVYYIGMPHTQVDSQHLKWLEKNFPYFFLDKEHPQSKDPTNPLLHHFFNFTTHSNEPFTFNVDDKLSWLEVIKHIRGAYRMVQAEALFDPQTDKKGSADKLKKVYKEFDNYMNKKVMPAFLDGTLIELEDLLAELNQQLQGHVYVNYHEEITQQEIKTEKILQQIKQVLQGQRLLEEIDVLIQDYFITNKEKKGWVDSLQEKLNGLDVKDDEVRVLVLTIFMSAKNLRFTDVEKIENFSKELLARFKFLQANFNKENLSQFIQELIISPRFPNNLSQVDETILQDFNAVIQKPDFSDYSKGLQALSTNNLLDFYKAIIEFNKNFFQENAAKKNVLKEYLLSGIKEDTFLYYVFNDLGYLTKFAQWASDNLTGPIVEHQLKISKIVTQVEKEKLWFDLSSMNLAVNDFVDQLKLYFTTNISANKEINYKEIFNPVFAAMIYLKQKKALVGDNSYRIITAQPQHANTLLRTSERGALLRTHTENKFSGGGSGIKLPAVGQSPNYKKPENTQFIFFGPDITGQLDVKILALDLDKKAQLNKRASLTERRQMKEEEEVETLSQSIRPEEV